MKNTNIYKEVIFIIILVKLQFDIQYLLMVVSCSFPILACLGGLCIFGPNLQPAMFVSKDVTKIGPPEVAECI